MSYLPAASGGARALLVAFLAAMVPAAFADGPAPQLVSLQKIWDAAPHNAFTDLVRYNGVWYCTFREATGHGVTVSGSVRVLRSTDGSAWTSAAHLTSDIEDLRDPHLVITPDNRLMLYAAVVTPSPVNGVTHRNFVWFSQDGSTWTPRVEFGEPNIWMWRITWHQGIAYGIGYAWTPTVFLRLYRSTDGVNFTIHVGNMGATGTVNETSRIIFLQDGTACVLARDKALGRALPPYTDWTWIPASATVGGPEMIRLPDGRFLAGTRLYDGTVRTSLSWVSVTTGALTECLTLPSGGDTSYAGMVWHEDMLWMSYYSTHEGRSSIYLAKIAIPVQSVATITDTFSRADGTEPGFTEEPQFAWFERLTTGGAWDVARIEQGRLVVAGYDGTGPQGTGAGAAIIDANLPDLVISAELRFALNNPAQSAGSNTGGFMLRKPRLDASIGDNSSLGQITVQMHPSGGLYIGERTSAGPVTLYADNPFISGLQDMASLNVFGGAGSLPPVLNGLPFDADGDGRLESAEPFRLTAALHGTSLEVRVNGASVASVTTHGAASTPSNFAALFKNRWTSSTSAAPSDVLFDDLNVSVVGVNDNCDQARWIIDDVTRGTTVGATSDGTSGCAPPTGDVWYRYSPPITGDLLIDVCGDDFSPAVSVFDACGGNELACATACEAATCPGGGACLRVPVLQSAPVLIRVGSVNAQAGSFALDVRTAPPRVLVHRGDRNPREESPPFTLDTNASAAELTLAPGANDQPHWRIEAAANRRANYQYKLSPEHWSDPAGWTLTAHVRAVSAAGLFQSYVELTDDRDTWSLNLVTEGLAPGLWTLGTALQADQHVGAFDPAERYHTIQIVYDPQEDGGQGAARYYLDGALVGMQTRTQVADRSLARLVWGDNVSGGGASDTRWSFLRFEPGQHPLPACGPTPFDTDGDGDVDQDDFGTLQACWSSAGTLADCACMDQVRDGEVDLLDFEAFLRCASGPSVPAAPLCP